MKNIKDILTETQIAEIGALVEVVMGVMNNAHDYGLSDADTAIAMASCLASTLEHAPSGSIDIILPDGTPIYATIKGTQ